MVPSIWQRLGGIEFGEQRPDDGCVRVVQGRSPSHFLALHTGGTVADMEAVCGQNLVLDLPNTVRP